MSFKKLLAVPLIVATLGLTVPAKKAEAGVIILFSTASLFSDANKPIGYAVGGTLGAATMYGGLVFGIPLYQLIPGLGLISMVGGLVLDANGNLPKEALATYLVDKYNFIDNQVIIESLVSAIKTKHESVKHINPEAYIALTESETRSILEAANLSEGEIQQVVNDLK